MKRVVITGIGLTAPNANNLKEFRGALLEGKSGIQMVDHRYVGKVPAGVCNFQEDKYQKKKMRRRGTRAGSIGIYCAHEALLDAGLDFTQIDFTQVGIYVGITEHGNAETENEIYLLQQNNYDVHLWSHHHNPRTVANAPAGEISIALKATGPHYTIGAACAAGNLGLIHAYQMIQLNEVKMALAGGLSESAQTFGIFAGFQAEGALAVGEDLTKLCRPLDKNRSGVIVSEGGCLFVVESLEDAQKRGAKIYAELVGYGVSSDAQDFILPSAEGQVRCINLALKRANIKASDVDLINLHATGTKMGDEVEIKAVKEVFGNDQRPLINTTKGLIGHAMGAAGALELAGNILSFEDHLVHHCFNLEQVDPECELTGLVKNTPKENKNIRYLLNNSFGMLGINSTVILKKFEGV